MADQAAVVSGSDDHPAVPATAAEPPPLEFDSNEANDADSAYAGSARGSATSTLASSIMKYREENGRTYHSYGSTEHWVPSYAQ